MRFLGFIIMMCPLCTVFYVFNKNDLFSPKNIFTLVYIITILIPTLLFYQEELVNSLSNDFIIDAILTDSIYFKYCLLQTISYYLVILGMSINIKFKKNRKKQKVQQLECLSKYKIAGILSSGFGLIAFLLIMHKTGGVLYFFSHLQYRTILLRNVSWEKWLISLLEFGPLLVLYSFKGSNKKISMFMMIYVLMTGIMLGLGGRKALLILIIEMLMVYNYAIKQIKIKKLLNFKTLASCVCVLLFFNIFVALRKEGALELLISNPYFFIQEYSRDFEKILISESYVAYYMSAIKYFRYTPLWLGASFKGLLTAIIPSAIFANKPPVDDGMYMYSICKGRTDIFPIMPTRELDLSSYPLETFNSMYANFGIIGLFIGMFLLGVVIKKAYIIMKNNNYTFIYILIYGKILFNFQFSTLRIFQVTEAIFILWCINNIIKNIKGVKII